MSDALIEQGFAKHQQGQLKEAEEIYQAVLVQDVNNLQALQLMGALMLSTGRHEGAVEMMKRSLEILKARGKLEPQHTSLHNNLAIALQKLGRNDEAEGYVREALAIDPSLAQLQIMLGDLLLERGDFVTATHHYEKAISLQPTSIACLCSLGAAYVKMGKFEDAKNMYARFVAANPQHREARIDLAQTLRALKKYDEAIEGLSKLAAEFPDDLMTLQQLGITYTLSGRLHLARGKFEQILARQPDDAEALLYLANIEESLGNSARAQEYYRRSIQQRPVMTINANKPLPDFRALLLFAPGAGNTPLEHLLRQTGYESHILHFMPGITYDIQDARGRADVVMNLIADADLGVDILLPAAELIDQIGKPIINHPRKIMSTDRASIAALLANLPGCRVPETARLTGKELRAPGFDPAQIGFRFPMLVRLTGTHGGDHFEMVSSQQELDVFTAGWPDGEFYLINFIDYRSADGFFRKYRFIFIDDVILPYHLAIDDTWKIHHASTDMINQPWMQQEEKNFLDDMNAFVTPQQIAALHTIRTQVGLDYFGIDCGFDQEGNVVVFEVNAGMLVHQNNEKFPYKYPAVERIKTEFGVMLGRHARRLASN